MDLNYKFSTLSSFVGSYAIKEGMSLQFVVSHIETEENLLKVWIQMDPVNLHQINECILKLKGVLERHGGFVHQRQLTLGSRYLVKPRESDNWYRAVILRHPQSDGSLVLVHYIDYGHTGLIHVNDVRTFNEKLFTIVPQATKCIVAGVASATGEAWSPQAVDYLTTTLRNKKFVGNVVNVFRDILYIQIMMNGIPLSHHLIEKRLGVPIGSSAMSQSSSLIHSGIETYRALPLDANQEHLVYVSHIESPQKFYIQLACKEPELNSLMECIDRYGNKHGFYPLEQIGLLPGTPCITQFSEDGSYYRAIVTTITGNKCKVTYVDYGNSEVKSCSELNAIPREFLTVPAQARECSLPPEVSIDNNTFHEAVNNKVLNCRIIRQQGTTYFVMLFCDETPIIARALPNGSSYTLLNLPLGTTHNVFVTYVYSPLRLYCQLAQNTVQIEGLMADLASMYDHLEPGANTVCTNECREGKAVCAKFSEDELWYRAVILTPVIRNKVSVQFVDYGNEDEVDLENIKRLMPSLFQLPIQALPFGLSSLEAFSNEVLESNAIIKELERLTLNIPLVAKLDTKIDDVYSVSLFDVSSTPPICINGKIQEFVKEFVQTSSTMNEHARPADTPKSMMVNPLSNQFNERPAAKEITYDDLYPLVSEGTLEEVIVIDSSGPESFYCQFKRDSCELDALMDDLAAHYNLLSEKEEAIPSVSLGMLCVAKYSEDDNWYRAKIVGVLRVGGVEVLYVDYGNREQIEISRVKRILPQFLLLPFKAVECSLANLSVSSIQSNVVESFNSTVVDASFTAIFKGRNGYVYSVELLDSEENKISEKFQQMCKSAPINNWEPQEKAFENDGDGWNETPKETVSDSWDYKQGTNSKTNLWNAESTHHETTSDSNEVLWKEEGEETETKQQPTSFDKFSSKKPYRKEFREQNSYDNKQRRYQDDNNRGRQSDRRPNRDRRAQFGDSGSSDERSSSGRRAQFGDSGSSDERSSSGSRRGGSRSRKGNQNSFQSDLSSRDSSHYTKNQFSDVKEITEYKEIDIPCGSFRYINVLQVVNPNEFYCQLVDDTSELSVVMEKIGQVYGSLRESELTLNNPVSGKICCALYSKDCAWYRARIKSVIGNSAEVFFVDYGNAETVPLTSIKTLKQEFLNLPVQTLRCSCLGIKPEGITWSEKDISTFKEMAEEKSLLAQFVSKEDNKTFLVNLIPVDKLKEGILNKEFLNSGHGKKLETGSPQLKVPYTLSLQANLVKPVLNSGEKAEIVVTWAFSIETFFCQLTSFISQFKDMMTEIQNEYNSMSELEAVIDRPQLNTYCMSQFSEDGIWYRAKIMHLQGNDIGVYYVDYGNNELVGRTSIKYILPQFTTLPTQAIKCNLNGIKAANNATINEGILQKYFVGNTVCTFVTDCDDYYLVDLENDGKSVAQLLVNDRLAVPTGDIKLEVPERTQEKSIPKLDFTQKKGMFIEVTVSYALSPYEFWCQPTSEFEKLNEVSSKIETNYSDKVDDEIESAANLRKGAPCVAKFTEDGQWYRAIIKYFQDDKAEVLFIDYGNSDLVPLHQVKAISSELLSIPAQAVLCSLHRIPPTLTEEQQTEFADLVDGQTMAVQLFDISSDGALIVTLYDTSSDPKVNIAEKLYGEVLENVSATLYPHPVPDGVVDGYISLVNSVSDFYIQLTSDEEDIYKLKDDLALCYNDISAEDLSVENPKLQMACCAKYTEDDSWYRAVITGIDDEQCIVHFVDFGNEEILPLNAIKILKEEFLALPYLAFKCCLDGVEPISGDSWSSPANDWLFEFTQEKKLQIQFHSSNIPIPVTLSYGGSDIADNMISAELATRKDESEVEFLETTKESIKDNERLATVSYVSSAESFYITFADKSDDLYNLRDKLQEMYSEESEQLTDCSVSQKCIAKFSEDEAWYRAEVTEISEESVTIKFIDYGNSETTTYDKLKVIQPDLLSVDAFAVECTFFGLKPNPEKLEEAKNLLELLIQDKEIKVEIIKQQTPLCVNIKINGEYIDASLLEKNLYVKVSEVNELDKMQVDNLTVTSDEATGKVEFATVPHVVSAEVFYITFADKADELFNFHEKLQQTYNDESDQLKDCVLSQKCIAKFSKDEAWYRAEVIEVSEESVTVKFLDYGNSETTTRDNLKVLQEDLLSVEPFAVECTLYGLKPKPELSEEAKALLEELILGKDVCVEVIGEQKPFAVTLNVDGQSITSQLLESNLFVETVGAEVKNVENTEVDLDRLYVVVPLGESDVVVSHVLSPSEFYIQLVNNLSELYNLSEKIAEIYAEDAAVQNLSELVVGQMCAAHDPVKQKWARALITKQNENEVEVTFVDYGYSAYIYSDLIKQLLPELQSLSFQSVKCSLGEICPVDGKEWSEETCNFFQNLVANEQVLTAQFKGKEHCYIIKLFHMNNDVEDILVEKGMACKKTSEMPANGNIDIDESSIASKDVFSDEAEVLNNTEANLELSYDSEDVKSSDYLVTENADTDESSGYVKDDISSEENLPNNIEADLDLPYDKEPLEFPTGEEEANLEFPCDADKESSVNLLTENICVDESSGYLKKEEMLDIVENAETNLEHQYKDEMYVSDVENESFPSERQSEGKTDDYASVTKDDMAGLLSESSNLSGFVSVVDSTYASAEECSTNVSSENVHSELHDESFTAEECPCEDHPSLQDENPSDAAELKDYMKLPSASSLKHYQDDDDSSDAVDSKVSLEIPCESSLKHDTVSTHLPREEKIVPGQLSYIEMSNIQNEITPEDKNKNSSDSTAAMATNANEPVKCDMSDRGIDESHGSEKEFGLDQPQNLLRHEIMESSPKDFEHNLSECDADSGTGNASFTTSATDSTTETHCERSQTTSSLGTSEQEHDEIHQNSIEHKVAPSDLSFSDDKDSLCNISAYDKENVTDRTMEEDSSDAFIQQEESDKKLQRVTTSAEDKIVPGQLSYFTETS